LKKTDKFQRIEGFGKLPTGRYKIVKFISDIEITGSLGYNVIVEISI